MSRMHSRRADGDIAAQPPARMSSSARRRTMPKPSNTATSNNNNSDGTGRGSARSTPTSSRCARASKAASKKRRYVDLENRCRNPFCGAALENKKQLYCDGNRFCQLRRGLALLCAWPHAPPTDNLADDDAVPFVRLAMTGSDRSASASADITAAASGDKRPRSSAATTPREATTAASKKPRGLKRHPSVDSITVPSGSTTTPKSTPTPTSTPTAATPTTTARQVKAAKIDVVPLGVGMRAGGGGRYVRSGNRTEINSSSQPPSFSRFPPTTPTGTSSTPATSSFPVSTSDAALSTPQTTGPSTPRTAPTPSRLLVHDNSLPVTTTNRSRDPRVRAAAAAAAAASTSAVTGTNGDAPVRKTMSAADYLNMSRSKDPSKDPTALFETMSSMSTSSLPPSEQDRPLDRSSSSIAPSLLNAPPLSSSREHHSATHGSQRPLRRAQSETTARDPSQPFEPPKNDWYASNTGGNSTNSHNSNAFRSSDEWLRPRRGESDGHNYAAHQDVLPYAYDLSSSHNVYNTNSHNHHHRDQRDHQDAPPNYSDGYDHKPSRHHDDHYDHRPSLARPSSSSSSYRADHHDTPAPTPTPREETPSPPPPVLSRAERLFGSLLRCVFSYSDPFVKLIVTRMASFLPEEREGIRAISYTTTTKRKLQFYLDYAKRVERCCGRLAKLTVGDGVARLTIANRDWLVLHGTSTASLYHAILERLYHDSTRWRALILEMKSIHSIEKRVRFGGAIPGVSFLKLWSALKIEDAGVGAAADFDLQTSYTMGKNRFHYVFCIGNLEVGSGSAVNQVDAFKIATSKAFAFLSTLTILPPHDVKRVAKIDGLERRASNTMTRPRSSESSGTSSRRASASSSLSSPRTTASPRGNGATTPRVSTASASVSNRSATGSTGSTGAPDAGCGSSPRSRSTASTVQQSPSASVSSRERIVEAPLPPPPVQVSIGEPTLARRDLRIKAIDLDAAFSPVVLSERSVSDDEDADDQMSVSSKEDNADQKTPKTSSVPTNSVPAPISTTPALVPTTTSVSTASSKPTVVAAAAPLSACRFCEKIRETKPGMSCMKCLRKR